MWAMLSSMIFICKEGGILVFHLPYYFPLLFIWFRLQAEKKWMLFAESSKDSKNVLGIIIYIWRRKKHESEVTAIFRGILWDWLWGIWFNQTDCLAQCQNGVFSLKCTVVAWEIGKGTINTIDKAASKFYFPYAPPNYFIFLMYEL